MPPARRHCYPLRMFYYEPIHNDLRRDLTAMLQAALAGHRVEFGGGSPLVLRGLSTLRIEVWKDVEHLRDVAVVVEQIGHSDDCYVAVIAGEERTQLARETLTYRNGSRVGEDEYRRILDAVVSAAKG